MFKFKNFEEFVSEQTYNQYKENNRLVEQKYSYGCVMAQLDKKSISEYYPDIDESDLYLDENGDLGMEHEPHVTALYGLHSDEIDDKVVQEVCEKHGKIDIALKDISAFENEKYDVLKFGVVSETLNKLNEELASLPHTNDFPDYNPHCTIAYMKKGTAKKYTEKFKDPIVLESKVLEYSKPGDDSDKKRKVYFKLKESSEKPNKALKEAAKNYKNSLKSELVLEKESWPTYLNLLGLDSKKFKKLDKNSYEYYKKAYMKSDDEAEFEQNYLEDLERDAKKTKI